MADVNYTAPGDVPAEFWKEALKYSKQTGADPYLLAAIGKHETGYGTLGAGRDGFALGYGYYAPGNFNINYMDIPGRYDVQLYSAGRQINSFFGSKPVTQDSIKAFMEQSWKPGDQNWYKGVWSIYESYNKDPALQNHNPGFIDKIGTVADDSPLGAAKKAGETVGNLVSGKYNGPIAFFVILVLIGVMGFFSFSKIFTNGGK